MLLSRNPAHFRELTDKQRKDWNQTIFLLFWKIWGFTLFLELVLFAFFSPTPDCSRRLYAISFILIPSGSELFFLVCFQLLFTRLIKSRKRYVVSLYTIALITLFAGITACVHTSVKILPAMLLFPMMLTPLYKDRIMTLLQAVLVILLYIADTFYFIPNSPYMPPSNLFIEVAIFIGGTIATCLLLGKVNETLLRNEESSRRDSLTHLYNHENFYEELECFRRRFRQQGSAFSVLIADIDNFKKVNDTYGHAFGDEVIRSVAELFLRTAPAKSICARYGGEEFAMILPSDDPLATAEKIRSSFAALPFNTPEGIRYFTLSIGAAVYRQEFPNASSFFEEADKALYRAKQNGKNRVETN